MNRFDLEERITDYANHCEQEIENIIYMIGDSKERPTEDELLNVLIGFQASQKFRYNRLWETFEDLVKNVKLEVKEPGMKLDMGEPYEVLPPEEESEEEKSINQMKRSRE